MDFLTYNGLDINFVFSELVSTNEKDDIHPHVLPVVVNEENEN